MRKGCEIVSSMSKISFSFLLKIAILLLVIMNFALLLKVKSANQQIEIISEKTELKNNILLNNLYFLLESENEKIDGEILLESESGKDVRLAELVSSKPKLFLRYSELQCDMCIDYSLKYLNSIADSIGHTNVVILASYKTMRELSIFKRINKINFPVYRIPEEGLGIPIESYSIPYLFIANESLRAENLHILNKDIVEMSSIFLSLIPSKFYDGPEY